MEEPPTLQMNEMPPFPSLISIPQLDTNLPPPPEVDPNVCRLIRSQLGNVSLTGYVDPTAKPQSTSAQNLPRYRQVFLDNAEVVKGKPSKLTPKDEDILTMKMLRFFKYFLSTHPDYPGVDIRIIKATVDCQQLVLSLSRDPNEVKRKDDDPASAFKEVRVQVRTPDHNYPEQLAFQAIDMENAKTLWMNSIDMNMSLIVSLKNKSLSFEFGDLLGLHTIALQTVIMRKSAALFRVRVERSQAPFGMISWASTKFEDARSRLSKEERKEIASTKFLQN